VAAGDICRPCPRPPQRDPHRPSGGGTVHVAFGAGDGLGLRDFRTFAAQCPTPHNCCVRFVAAVAGGPRNTRYRAGATPYPGRTLTGWTRSAYPDAPPGSGRSPGMPYNILIYMNIQLFFVLQRSSGPNVYTTSRRAVIGRGHASGPAMALPSAAHGQCRPILLPLVAIWQQGFARPLAEPKSRREWHYRPIADGIELPTKLRHAKRSYSAPLRQSNEEGADGWLFPTLSQSPSPCLPGCP
jgi:hypothetical protein